MQQPGMGSLPFTLSCWCAHARKEGADRRSFYCNGGTCVFCLRWVAVGGGAWIDEH